MKKYQKFFIYVPYGEIFDSILNCLSFNGCKIDDACSATRNGRLVIIWIPSEELEEVTEKDKIGYFMEYPQKNYSNQTGKVEKTGD